MRAPLRAAEQLGVLRKGGWFSGFPPAPRLSGIAVALLVRAAIR